MDIYIDVETMPTQRDDERERIAAAVEPPGSYKKPESRAKWLEEHGPTAADEQWRKTALDGTWGELACVCYAIDDGDVVSLYRRDRTPESEVYLLRQLYAGLADATRHQRQSPLWVGHNVGFDLRFLHHRSVVRDVRPTVYLPYNDAPWKGSYMDTMAAWVGARGGIKLTELCRALGIEVHDEIDGSQVWDAIQAGRLDQVVAHCEADVVRVRTIARRLRWGDG